MQQGRLVLSAALCFVFGLQFASCQNFGCTYTGSAGSYDLTPLSSQILAKSSDGIWNYYIQMCGIATGAGTYQQYCTAINSMVCQSYIQNPSGNTYAVAYPNDQTGKHQWNEQSNGIQLVAYGLKCNDNYNRVAQITITCDPTVTGAITSISNSVVETPATCAYAISFNHAVGCAGSGGGGGGGSDSDSGSSGLSGGSVFLIIFFVSAFVYVAGGCFYKRYQKGTTGMIESCPNNEFWTAIPGLVKDGCLFTVRKLKSLCGGGGGGSSTGGTGSYETI